MPAFDSDAFSTDAFSTDAFDMDASSSPSQGEITGYGEIELTSVSANTAIGE